MVQVGCDPSLSSIPVLAQRSFADALAELAAWLAQPENQREFLLVFLDDQLDIKTWVSSPMNASHHSQPCLRCLLLSIPSPGCGVCTPSQVIGVLKMPDIRYPSSLLEVCCHNAILS